MYEADVVARMTERGLKLATAESTVGGMIGHLLTNVPGSSKVFVGGIIAYHGGPKMDLLGVDRDTLRAEGSISEHVVRAMAEGAKGVDILGSRARTLTFLEVKDFRRAMGDRESRIQNELPFEIGFKACDTVAGVVGAARDAGPTAFQGFAQMLVDSNSPIEIILWLEEPSVTSKAELLRRKSRLSTATSKLKQCCKWLTDRAFVVNSEEYKRILTDLEVLT